ncbi:hypothetical protein V1525DRAFT_24404 [Lipomyces kononenkoae]|uniref:Uncharacterized protein n=1 Tax=Lipomyces kononenkoae TaxID=34357 RepID=A0ACC3SUY9_LIPKO
MVLPARQISMKASVFLSLRRLKEHIWERIWQRCLYLNLSTRLATASTISDNHTLGFHGLDSYIRRLAHILNFIVKEIHSKSGGSKSANEACDKLRSGKEIWADCEF